MIHRPETTAESFFQAHKEMTVTSKEQACQKQLDFLESMTRHVRPLGRYDENSDIVEIQVFCRGYEEPHIDEGCFAATATIQGSFCGRLHTSISQRVSP